MSLLKHIYIYFSIFGKGTLVLFLKSHFIEGACVKRCSAKKKGQARMPRLNLHNYFDLNQLAFKIEM